MIDETKILCWRDLCEQVLKLENKNANQLDIITGLRKELGALRDELKAAQDSLAKLESPPVFEVGKCYRNKRGEITEPLRAAADGPYVFRDPKTLQTYDARGMRFANDPSDFDLVAGPVSPPPTWTPPASLPNCIATATGDGFQESVAFLHCTHARMKELYRDYTEPASGRWRVENGAATWMGDA